MAVGWHTVPWPSYEEVLMARQLFTGIWVTVEMEINCLVSRSA
jgi:hypothetical protein